MEKAPGSSRARKTSAAAKKVATPAVDTLLPRESVEGYRAFRAFRFPDERRRFLKLAKHQHPNILMIGCVDSRVPLEIIFDVDPGDIFVVRNIAALVPPYDAKGDRNGTSAAIEYAVCALNVAHIVVVGHARCGGVRAAAQRKLCSKEPALDGADAGCDGVGAAAKRKPCPKDPTLDEADYVGKWVSLIAPPGTPPDDPRAFDAYCETLCKTTVERTLQTLRRYPFIHKREKEGELSLHGAYFFIEEGELLVLDEGTGDFIAVS